MAERPHISSPSPPPLSPRLRARTDASQWLICCDIHLYKQKGRRAGGVSASQTRCQNRAQARGCAAPCALPSAGRARSVPSITAASGRMLRAPGESQQLRAERVGRDLKTAKKPTVLSVYKPQGAFGAWSHHSATSAAGTRPTTGCPQLPKCQIQPAHITKEHRTRWGLSRGSPQGPLWDKTSPP